MKNLNLWGMTLVGALWAMCLAACDNGKQKSVEVPVDTTVAIVEEEPPVVQTEMPEGGFLLTREGIAGVVEIGQSLETLPDKVKKFYDKVEVSQEKDDEEGEAIEYTLVEFKLKGKDVLEVRSWEGKVVDLIHIEEEGLHFVADGKEFGVGSLMADIEKLPNFRRLREYKNVSCVNGIFLCEEEGEISDIWLGGVNLKE